MKTEPLKNSILKHIRPDEVALKYFFSLLKETKIKRKEFFVKEGEVSRETAFVVKGCLRSYSIDKNGFEHIVQFAPTGWWIADILSIISNQPGKLYIDALEDSEVLLLKRDDQEKLFLKHPVFERFFRIITENSIAAHHSRLMDYMGLSAQERFEGFCKRYPSLVRNLPQKQIASYIGVTPEFLSKIKRLHLKKERKDKP